MYLNYLFYKEKNFNHENEENSCLIKKNPNQCKY